MDTLLTLVIALGGIAVLAWGGPKNLSRRRRKQEALDLRAMGEERVV